MVRRFLRPSWRTWLGVAALAGGALHAQAQDIGRVLSLEGQASVEREARREPLAAGTPIRSGDRVRTGADGGLQLWFTDGSIVALRAGSELHISDYRYDKDASTDRSIMGLLRGGLRTVTGFIARQTRQSYRVITPTATIGVRGTHYTLVSCQADCPAENGNVPPDGLYGGVSDGRIAVANDSGEYEFGQQEYFRVANAQSAPERLLTSPAVLAARSGSQRARPDAADSADDDRETRRAVARIGAAAAAAGLRPAAVLAALRSAAAANDRPGFLAVLQGLASDITVASARAGDDGGTLLESRNFTPRQIQAVLPESADFLVFDAASLAAAVRRAFPVDGSLADGVFWTQSEASSGVGIGSHRIWGDKPAIAMPTAGLATYQFLGGTVPTDNYGRTGQLSAGNLLADFGSRTLRAVDPLTVTFSAGAADRVPSLRYELAAGAQWQMTDATQRLSGVSCAGCAAGTAQGDVNGRFLGTRATGYGAVFSFSGSVPVQALRPNGTTTLVPHEAAVAAGFGRR
jgi:hypothetical protein